MPILKIERLLMFSKVLMIVLALVATYQVIIFFLDSYKIVELRQANQHAQANWFIIKSIFKIAISSGGCYLLSFVVEGLEKEQQIIHEIEEV